MQRIMLISLWCCRFDSSEKWSQLLVKPCLDIRLWKGYADSSDSQRHTVFREWYVRFVVDFVSGNASFCNSLNYF